MHKKFIVAIIILTLVSFMLRMYRVNEPQKYYFDEVYHVVTAKAIAKNNPDAYNPFAAPPEKDTAYDWLHPPLAKLFQAASINLFGDNPTAWRLPGVIFGTLLIPLTFTVAAIIFNPATGIFVAFVIAFENMTFVMSRITMNDIFITFFSLASFCFAYLFVKKQKLKFLLLTAFLSGAAWASKWTGLYTLFAVLAYICLHQLLTRKFNFKLVFLIFIPPLIYLASYSQFWLQGHTTREFIDLHKQIWWYQNRSDLSHPYGTTPLFCVPNGLEGPRMWCPWALDVKPVYFSYESYGEKSGYIYNVGNPLVFWLGIISILYMILKYFQERKKQYGIILFGYFIFWLPWVFSPRILFLHHYLPSIPFLAISLGWMLSIIYKTHYRYLSVVVILLIVAVFFYLYPISSGLPIDPKLVNKFLIIGSWRN